MKLTLSVIALTGLLAVSPLHAQTSNAPAASEAPRPPRGMSVDRRLEALNKALTLTDDQKTKVKDVLESEAKEMKDLAGLSREDRRTKLTSIREETTKKLKDILTPEQFTKYQAMPQGRGPRPGGAPGANGAPAAPPAGGGQ